MFPSKFLHFLSKLFFAEFKSIQLSILHSCALNLSFHPSHPHVSALSGNSRTSGVINECGAHSPHTHTHTHTHTNTGLMHSNTYTKTRSRQMHEVYNPVKNDLTYAHTLTSPLYRSINPPQTHACTHAHTHTHTHTGQSNWEGMEACEGFCYICRATPLYKSLRSTTNSLHTQGQAEGEREYVKWKRGQMLKRWHTNIHDSVGQVCPYSMQAENKMMWQLDF